MVDVPTRTLRDYVASLTAGGNAGLIDQNLNIRNDVVTSAQAAPPGGLTGQVLGKISDADYGFAWIASGAGDMIQAMYDPQMIQADAFDRANHTGTQDVSTITGLAAVATSGSYADLSGTPSFFAPRSTSVGSTATLTPNVDQFDQVAVSAQAAPLTIAAPTGTPVDAQSLTIRLRDNGTSRAISWDSVYVDASPSLPDATIVGLTMIYKFVFNASTNVWDLASHSPAVGMWGP